MTRVLLSMVKSCPTPSLVVPETDKVTVVALLETLFRVALMETVPAFSAKLEDVAERRTTGGGGWALSPSTQSNSMS